MTVMSSLWSSHLTGWPQWTAPGGRGGGASALLSHRLMNNQQITGMLHLNLQVQTHKRRPVETSEGGGWMLGRRGQDRGDDPETGGNGCAARLEEAQNPQQRVLRISFVCWSTERKPIRGKSQVVWWFLGHRYKHRSEEDTQYIPIDVLGRKWRRLVLFLGPFRCLLVKYGVILFTALGKSRLLWP